MQLLHLRLHSLPNEALLVAVGIEVIISLDSCLCASSSDSGILARAGPTSDAKDFDVYNGSNCLKLKREAEAAASDAAAAYKQYEQALARRSLEKKATPTTDSTNQDVYNGSGCLKFKREAESAAEAAAEAYAKYDSALAARGFVEV